MASSVSEATNADQPVVRSTNAAADDGPSGEAKVEAAPEVKAGDNLYNIAKSHNTTVKAIRDANGLTNANIRPGQKLIIPKPAAAE